MVAPLAAQLWVVSSFAFFDFDQQWLVLGCFDFDRCLVVAFELVFNLKLQKCYLGPLGRPLVGRHILCVEGRMEGSMEGRMK
jgi:hypothetical protein